MDFLDGCAVARKMKSYCTVGSLFCGDNLDKSVSKIKGDSDWIINNMVDRA
jgi:hypothetical protein